MLCDKCKQNPASVIMHVQDGINGTIAVLNLCTECAAAMSPGNMSFEDIVKNFMNSVMGLSGDFEEKDNSGGGGIYDALKCNTCGLTYEGFKASGKLGCADCYNAFRQPLSKLFKNIHGGSVHTGKLPARGGAALLKVRETGKLREQLKKHIEEEEFEEAAKVRDMIKKLNE